MHRTDWVIVSGADLEQIEEKDFLKFHGVWCRIKVWIYLKITEIRDTIKNKSA